MTMRSSNRHPRSVSHHHHQSRHHPPKLHHLLSVQVLPNPVTKQCLLSKLVKQPKAIHCRLNDQNQCKKMRMTMRMMYVWLWYSVENKIIDHGNITQALAMKEARAHKKRNMDTFLEEIKKYGYIDQIYWLTLIRCDVGNKRIVKIDYVQGALTSQQMQEINQLLVLPIRLVLHWKLVSITSVFACG